MVTVVQTHLEMFLIWSLVVLVCLAQAEDVDKKIEDAENLVISLSKKTDVDIKYIEDKNNSNNF